jgi:hypothetical protein
MIRERGCLVGIAAIACLVLLTGCVSESDPPVSVNQLPGDSRLGASEIVNVRLDEESSARIDRFDYHGHTSRQKFATGPVWKRAFVGNSDSADSFRINSAKLSVSPAAGGFATRINYEAESTLTFDGHSYTVVAHGDEASAFAINTAIRQAIEECVADASKQTAAIMAAVGRTPKPATESTAAR